MKLSDERRKLLLHATHDAAIAFVEDMEHIRALIAQKDISRGELRRLSAILRRLIVEGDISNVAAPRMGKIKIKAPNNNPVYKNKNIQYLQVFVSGRANIFGWKGALSIWVTPPNIKEKNMFASINKGDFDKLVDMSPQNFLTQRVLFHHGEWASRKSVIKFVAHVMSGIHSGPPDTPEEKLLDRIRRGNTVCKSKSGKMEIKVRKRPANSDNSKLVYEKDKIDMTLIEILATARFLAASPDIAKLEKIVTEEASQPAT